MIKSYGELYQRRRTVAPAPEPEPQRLSGESFVDYMRRLHPPEIDASAGLSEAERRQVKEIKWLMSQGQWGVGNIIPNKLMPAVFDGAPLQGSPFTLEASSDAVGSIARKISASMSASLATDPAPQRRMTTDGPQRRPTMSYRLKQIMGDYELLDEVSFEESMAYWKVTEPRDRIALKGEAMSLGLMRAHATPLPAPQTPRQFHPAPHVENPKHQRFIPAGSPAADEEDTGGRNTQEATRRTSGHIQAMQACDENGYACYDGTGIELL